MSTPEHSEPAPTSDEIWRLFRETDRLMKQQAQEAEHRFQAIERLIKEQIRETEHRFQEEAERRAQEEKRRAEEEKRRAEEEKRRAEEEKRRTEEEKRRQEEEAIRQTEERKRWAEEARLRAKDLDRQFKETDRKIGKLGGRLGDFVEGLIKPSVARLFQARGIPVYKTYSDVSANNPKLGLATQIDLLAINSEVCALIEVKSKLSVEDVNEHLERMDKFKPLFPEYADKKAYGAVAAMVIPDDVAKYAYRKGFFILAQQGENVVILNDDKFVPIAW